MDDRYHNIKAVFCTFNVSSKLCSWVYRYWRFCSKLLCSLFGNTCKPGSSLSREGLTLQTIISLCYLEMISDTMDCFFRFNMECSYPRFCGHGFSFIISISLFKTKVLWLYQVLLGFLFSFLLCKRREEPEICCITWWKALMGFFHGLGSMHVFFALSTYVDSHW